MYVSPSPIQAALLCACPRCGIGQMFKRGITLDVVDHCPHCNLALAKNDSGDGPAVFMIFVLGFSLVPLALFLDYAVALPIWVHAVLWTVVALGLCGLTMRPMKAYVIALQFKHRPQTWEN